MYFPCINGVKHYLQLWKWLKSSSHPLEHRNSMGFFEGISAMPSGNGENSCVPEAQTTDRKFKPYWKSPWSTVLQGLSPYEKKKYVWKMLYIYMLGYDVDFGHMETVSLISAPKYPEKQVKTAALILIATSFSNNGMHIGVKLWRRHMFVS